MRVAFASGLLVYSVASLAFASPAETVPGRAAAVDPSGDAVAYGWYGEGQDPQTFVRTRIVFGRVFR